MWGTQGALGVVFDFTDIFVQGILLIVIMFGFIFILVLMVECVYWLVNVCVYVL